MATLHFVIYFWPYHVLHVDPTIAAGWVPDQFRRLSPLIAVVSPLLIDRRLAPCTPGKACGMPPGLVTPVPRTPTSYTWRRKCRMKTASFSMSTLLTMWVLRLSISGCKMYTYTHNKDEDLISHEYIVATHFMRIKWFICSCWAVYVSGGEPQPNLSCDGLHPRGVVYRGERQYVLRSPARPVRGRSGHHQLPPWHSR